MRQLIVFNSRTNWLKLFAVIVSSIFVTPAQASFHFMQIEQVIGGVNGDTTAQAIQLRMRFGGQNLVTGATLVAYDATGNNPITILTFPSNVTNSVSGTRILITTATLASHETSPISTDFTMDAAIPASYFAAGRLTYQMPGFLNGDPLWSVSWGGANYTGPNTGTTINDADGNFAPPFAGILPSDSTIALQFPGPTSAQSTNNAADYALTTGPATFTNNAGDSTSLIGGGSTPTPTPTPTQITPTPTPPITPTPTPGTPTATPTPGTQTPSPTVSPTPSAAPSPAQALNISTRMQVQTGSNVLIAGFIVSGTTSDNVVVRGIGPSLGAVGVSGALADPTLDLINSTGASVRSNDNWQDDSSQAMQLVNLGLAPTDTHESGIVETLSPAAYTAILAGKDQTTGVGLVEVYDISRSATAQLANISTRGFVLTGTDVMIGGFILGGNSDTHIVLRGIGPSLAAAGLSPVLADPTLELRDSSGTLLVMNDNWQEDAASASQLTLLGLAPSDPMESGIYTTLPPGSFTAILAGKSSGTGIGLVEIYNVH